MASRRKHQDPTWQTHWGRVDSPSTRCRKQDIPIRTVILPQPYNGRCRRVSGLASQLLGRLPALVRQQIVRGGEFLHSVRPLSSGDTKDTA